MGALEGGLGKAAESCLDLERTLRTHPAARADGTLATVTSLRSLLYDASKACARVHEQLRRPAGPRDGEGSENGEESGDGESGSEQGRGGGSDGGGSSRAGRGGARGHGGAGGARRPRDAGGHQPSAQGPGAASHGLAGGGGRGGVPPRRGPDSAERGRSSPDSGSDDVPVPPSHRC
jgi:hypothetical protein